MEMIYMQARQTLGMESEIQSPPSPTWINIAVSSNPDGTILSTETEIKTSEQEGCIVEKENISVENKEKPKPQVEVVPARSSSSEILATLAGKTNSVPTSHDFPVPEKKLQEIIISEPGAIIRHPQLSSPDNSGLVFRHVANKIIEENQSDRVEEAPKIKTSENSNWFSFKLIETCCPKLLRFFSHIASGMHSTAEIEMDTQCESPTFSDRTMVL